MSSRSHQRGIRKRRVESSEEPDTPKPLKSKFKTKSPTPAKPGSTKTRITDVGKRKLLLVLKALIRDAGRYFLEEDESETEIHIFPWYSIYVLFALTIWSRINVASSPESWWMIHPDEVFQSLEVAHSEMYGYGFRPYEFFLPPNGTHDLSHSERQHFALGMYSMRSWIYPRCYQFLFWMREYFGWNMRPFQVAKLVHSLIAGALPFIIYKYSKVIFPRKRDIAILAAGFIAFSQPLIILGTHTLIQSLLSPFIFLSLTVIARVAIQVNSSEAHDAFHNRMISGVSQTTESASENNNIDAPGDEDVVLSENGVCKVEDPTVEQAKDAVQLVASGLFIGIAVLVRPDSFFVIAISIANFVMTSPHVTEVFFALFPMTLGFFCGVFIGGWSDYLNYGTWFLSSTQWVTFQINYSSKLFGSHDFLMYFWDVLFVGHTAPGLTCLIAGVGLAYAFSNYFVSLKTLFDAQKKDMQGWKQTLALTVIMFVGYSLLSHKEIRFVHDAIILYLLCAAATVFMVFKALYLYIIEVAETTISKRRFIKLGLYAELFLYMFAGRLGCPRSSVPSSVMKWAYSGLAEAGQVNQCLDFVGRQEDVTGVFIDYSIHMVGAYTLLHRNVPIIAKTHFEFREWDIVSRIPVVTTNLLNKQNNVTINTIDSVSNFVTVQNVGLMMKYLISKPEYNYVITTGGRKLPKKGFREVFNISDVWVFKRSRARIDRVALEEYGRNLPIGKNASVLEYEGSWLVTLQLYEKAVERLNAAIALDTSSVRVWQLLSFALDKLDDKEKASAAQLQCHKIHGREACLKRTEKITLNPEYELKL